MQRNKQLYCLENFKYFRGYIRILSYIFSTLLSFRLEDAFILDTICYEFCRTVQYTTDQRKKLKYEAPENLSKNLLL